MFDGGSVELNILEDIEIGWVIVGDMVVLVVVLFFLFFLSIIFGVVCVFLLKVNGEEIW